MPANIANPRHRANVQLMPRTHNNQAKQQMQRIALLRKNALFAGSPRGGATAAILSSLTSTCRRHNINPQAY